MIAIRKCTIMLLKEALLTYCTFGSALADDSIAQITAIQKSYKSCYQLKTTADM